MKIKFGIIFIFFIICIPVAAQQTVMRTVQELIDDAKTFDGQTVVIRGEAIGDMMPRGDFAWINVEDATGMIGIWLPLEDAQKISFLGSYHSKGDMVEVEGIFVRADQTLYGETAIRAQRFDVVAKGTVISHELNIVKVEASVVLLICAALLWGSREIIRRRRRAGK